MGALREQLRTWGNQCVGLNKTVKIRLRTDVHGSTRAAYNQARRIVVSFAALRTWERKKVRSRIMRDGKSLSTMPAQTAFEDVVVQIIKMSDDRGYEVHFIPEKAGVLEMMYEDVTDEEPHDGVVSRDAEEGWVNPASLQEPSNNGQHDPINITELFAGESE